MCKEIKRYVKTERMGENTKTMKMNMFGFRKTLCVMSGSTQREIVCVYMLVGVGVIK